MKHFDADPIMTMTATSDVLLTAVIRRKELRAWFVAEHVADASLVQS